MRTIRKNLLYLALLLTFFCGAVLVVIHLQLRGQALDNAESQAAKFLHSYRSVRHLVRAWQKPEVSRLQQSGQLDNEYFSPVLLSSTYIARGYLDFLNQSLSTEGEPRVEFKLATDNPRNPLNRADDREMALLEAMRRGEIEDFVSVDERGDEPTLFYAMATEPLTESCLQCHGDPAKAPRMLIAQYGDQGGFHEQVGQVRALISMRVPLAPYYEDADRLFGILAAALLLVFLALYLVIASFLGRLDRKSRKISEQKRELEKLSQQDAMTGTLNRVGFKSRFQHLLQIAKRYREPLCLVMMDIDRFKQINDTLGHAVGDEVLIEFTRRTQQQLRTADLFCRWGGEEFLVCLPQTTLENARKLAERMRLSLAEDPMQQGEREIHLTASYGVADSREGDLLDDIVKRADKAMYKAKQLGRNRVVLCTD